jgi:transglutaminase-like putative cysteine protease
MLITTLHETVFEYDRPIRGTFTEVRLWPVSDAGQTCREFSLSVDPMRPMTESVDYHGNMALMFNILPEHRRVVVSGRSVVETHRKPFTPQEPLTEFEVHKAQVDYLQFGGPVEDVPQIEELVDACGLRTADENAPWWEAHSTFAAVQNLNTLIFERFTYAPNTTDVHTRISEVFAYGCGVCQDFAHIFIAVCRAAGVPARYVSGYLVTRRSRSAQGSSASHAWVEILIPQMGWCAFDPTNNMLANDYYIKLAAGCDYRDVPPTRGIYKGYGVNCRMRVRVHTIVEGESLEAGEQAESDDAPTLEHDAGASTQRAPHELVG